MADVTVDNLRMQVTRSSRAAPWLRLLDPIALTRTLWARRDLIWQFTRREIVNRFRGTHLGWLWAILTPLFMLAVYTVVFSLILNSRLGGRDEGPIEFAILLFAGLTAFGVFAEPFGRSAALVANRRNYVRKMAFPLEIFPITAVLTALAYSAVGFVLVVLAHLVLARSISPTIWAFPLVLLPAILLAIGSGWLLSALGVYFRDLQQLTSGPLQRMLFFLTPIFYSVEMVPEAIRPILYINPLTVVIEGTRATLLLGEMPRWGLWGAWMVGSLVLAQVSYAFFMRARQGFADVV